MKISNGDRIDKVVTAITVNIINKMLDGPGTPPTDYPDAGPEDDADTGTHVLPDGAVVPNDPGNGAIPGSTSKACGCKVLGTSEDTATGGVAALGAVATALLVGARRRREKTTHRPGGKGDP